MTPSTQIDIGIDIHSGFYQVCILTDQDRKSQEQLRFETTTESTEALLQRIRDCGEGVRVAMEACTGAHLLYDLISDKTNAFAIEFDGRKVRERYPKRGRKTDKIDALHLAELASCKNLESVWVPPLAIRELRVITHSRRSRIELGVQTMNRVHALLKEHGFRWRRSSSSLWKPEGRKWLNAQMSRMKPFLETAIRQELLILDQNMELIRELDLQLIQWCTQSPAAQLLLSIPGSNSVGITTALAEIGDYRRFQTPKALTRYAGLDPSVYQSGSGQAKPGRISRCGRSLLRWIFCQLALVAIRSCAAMKAFYERIKRRTGSAGKAKVATARKLLCLFWHVLKSGRAYNNERKTLTTRKLKEHRQLMARATKKVPTHVFTAKAIARCSNWGKKVVVVHGSDPDGPPITEQLRRPGRAA